mmetsp:Transcript_17005/g.23808  ORF Transcript_17005/g.23808 Transcript_17005/m.23808 type:complete len:311 (+) Transcript_17005:103-1035(+)|eukprot:CAMPEP_0185264268 /NCGR_PEP_ID=MMETSP1359-20130426/21294_1 /TAXON_ID=552665 /ORGANISM="Bigelowiella longifila, Strain CCMP242" /LENGTH=310 /DNA_ID=CAMNT_0027852667 /DNA_START=30 /DNA_END=962 /DNA_ORIENTATION=+
MPSDQVNSLISLFGFDDVNVGETDVENGAADTKEDESFRLELTKYEPIRKDIEYLEACSDHIAKAKEEIDNVYVEEQKNRIISDIDKKLKKARSSSVALKKALTDKGGLKDQNEKFRSNSREDGSVEVEIRDNMYNFYMRKYFLAHKRYTSLAKMFKDKVHNRQVRDLKFLSNNLTTEKAEELIEKGLDKQFIEQQMNGEEQELGRLLAQADEVKQINQGVQEILEMFHEMAALVDAQQETIDNITCHVSQAKEYTGEAVVELHAAAEYQFAARKKMLICFVIAMIVLAVIIIIILSVTGAFDNNDDNNK